MYPVANRKRSSSPQTFEGMLDGATMLPAGDGAGPTSEQLGEMDNYDADTSTFGNTASTLEGDAPQPSSPSDEAGPAEDLSTAYEDVGFQITSQDAINLGQNSAFRDFVNEQLGQNPDSDIVTGAPLSQADLDRGYWTKSGKGSAKQLNILNKMLQRYQAS